MSVDHFYIHFMSFVLSLKKVVTKTGPKRIGVRGYALTANATFPMAMVMASP